MDEKLSAERIQWLRGRKRSSMLVHVAQVLLLTSLSAERESLLIPLLSLISLEQARNNLLISHNSNNTPTHLS